MIWNIHPHDLRIYEQAGCIPYYDVYEESTWDSMYEWINNATINDYDHTGKNTIFC